MSGPLKVTCEVNADQREYVRIVLANDIGDEVIEVVGYREGYATVSLISQGPIEGEQNFTLDVDQVKLLSDATDVLKVLLMKVARVKRYIDSQVENLLYPPPRQRKIGP
jgi:hypothetical protein